MDIEIRNDEEIFQKIYFKVEIKNDCDNEWPVTEALFARMMGWED